MTLDDLKLLLVGFLEEFRVISHIWEATTAIRMNTDPCCQRHHCSCFLRSIDNNNIDIAGHSSARVYNQNTVAKIATFISFIYAKISRKRKSHGHSCN